MNEEEFALPEVRYGCDFNKAPRLQQKWHCRDGDAQWTEWRDVPTVYEPPGVKTPVSVNVLD